MYYLCRTINQIKKSKCNYTYIVQINWCPVMPQLICFNKLLTTAYTELKHPRTYDQPMECVPYSSHDALLSSGL